MVHTCRSASVVFMKVNDLMLYLVGTGEYDELTRASLLDSLPALPSANESMSVVAEAPKRLCACGVMNCATLLPGP